MRAIRMAKRRRRRFTDEFKSEAVRLVREGGVTVSQAAKDLDVPASALRNWVKLGRGRQCKGDPGALTTAEKEELARLRREVKQLRMEREILKKTAAFFAKENE